ncbi:hypothetical protein PPL_01682 [Heterostelium album PN500]|uniref:Uncharacterized protein n=1 Tax=Heterostelium pallidum (strain ATCC 26659 / Pp 5 / PN500) TaxID=670386 RepID=D3B066_HETP5|nr:hypothetical protein PPL_01682 [Heterostelium album PN500]EFA84690.1 hypothetical protein PPL_01682 [Heterostelium album PN500]|eukprot:XP_020436803.1 hypothetical protein PPL_01682 [Heterostelium album PN500]
MLLINDCTSGSVEETVSSLYCVCDDCGWRNIMIVVKLPSSFLEVIEISFWNRDISNMEFNIKLTIFFKAVSIIVPCTS